MVETLRAACVVGWPVAHSKSPIIHGHWLAEYGIQGAYRREGVTAEDFPRFIATLADRGYVGCNVTIPHKETALTVSKPDARARAVGAANTLWLEEGRLRSTNTDVEGILASLDQNAPGWDDKLENAVVLGAGGAARAAVYGLLERGARKIHVVNRTVERAQAFRDQWGAAVHPAGWDEVDALLADADLIANSTSLGMVGNPDLDLDLSKAGDATVVFDAVYAPLRTSLLKAATDRGLRISDGLDMLLHQARRPFELWWGVRPDVTPELRSLVVDALKAEETGAR